VSSLQLGNQLLVEKRYAEALRLFLAHATEVPAEAPRAFVQAAECLRRTNTLSKPVPVEPGVTLVHQGDDAGAEAMYRRALAIDPQYFPALRGLAQVVPDGSDEERRVLEIAVALRLDPLLVQQLGEAYEREGRFGEARELYSRAFQANPSDRSLSRLLERVAERMSQE